MGDAQVGATTTAFVDHTSGAPLVWRRVTAVRGKARADGDKCRRDDRRDATRRVRRQVHAGIPASQRRRDEARRRVRRPSAAATVRTVSASAPGAPEDAPAAAQLHPPPPAGRCFRPRRAARFRASSWCQPWGDRRRRSPTARPNHSTVRFHQRPSTGHRRRPRRPTGLRRSRSSRGSRADDAGAGRTPRRAAARTPDAPPPEPVAPRFPRRRCRCRPRPARDCRRRRSTCYRRSRSSPRLLHRRCRPRRSRRCRPRPHARDSRPDVAAHASLTDAEAAVGEAERDAPVFVVLSQVCGARQWALVEQMGSRTGQRRSC